MAPLANNGQAELILSTIAVVLAPYDPSVPIGIGINFGKEDVH